MKIYTNGLGHMTKIPAMPIYGKNLLLQNKLADCKETWYVALGMPDYYSLYKL